MTVLLHLALIFCAPERVGGAARAFCRPAMAAAIVVENFACGPVAAAFVGSLMSLFSATRFALLSSLTTMSRDLLLAVLPGLLLLPLPAPWSNPRDPACTRPPQSVSDLDSRRL